MNPRQHNSIKVGNEYVTQYAVLRYNLAEKLFVAMVCETIVRERKLSTEDAEGLSVLSVECANKLLEAHASSEIPTPYDK